MNKWNWLLIGEDYKDSDIKDIIEWLMGFLFVIMPLYVDIL